MILQTLAESIQSVFDLIILLSKSISISNIPPPLSFSHLLQLIAAPSISSTQTNPDFMKRSVFQNHTLSNTVETLNAYIFQIREYTNACSDIKDLISQQQEIQQEYLKLEELLQKNETEIRKHIGTEQELKLYIDTLKSQFDEGQNERIELLANSKQIIKGLKAQKQILYNKLKAYENEQTFLNRSMSTEKRSRNVSNRKRSEKRERDRIKTEYVSSQKRKQPKKIPKAGQKNGEKLPPKKENGTHNVSRYSHKGLNFCNSNQKKLVDIKKKQQISYFSKINFQGSTRKDTHKDKDKSPLKNSYLVKLSNSKKGQKRVQSASRDKSRNKSNKKAHKSVFSASSLDFEKEREGTREEGKKVLDLQKFKAQYLDPEIKLEPK